MVTSLQSYQAQAKTLAQAPIPQADVERKEQMGKAWDAYEGKFADPLKTEKGEINKNVKPNKIAPIADKGVSFLFGQDLKIEIQDTEFIEEFWEDDDKKMTPLAKMAINSGLTGHPYPKRL